MCTTASAAPIMGAGALGLGLGDALSLMWRESRMRYHEHRTVRDQQKKTNIKQ